MPADVLPPSPALFLQTLSPTVIMPLDEFAYYEQSTGKYLIRNDRHQWIYVNEGSIRRHLSDKPEFAKIPGQTGNPIDQEISRIQIKCDVDYAGSLAGYDEGIVVQGGYRILVKEAPKLIEPMEGDWPTIRTMLDNMFVEPEHEQLPYVFGWLKFAIMSLRDKTFMPGQALVFAGKAESGKSLFQSLITDILGGRSAKAYRYMSGATTFNSELFGAEHLMIEDDVGSSDLRIRREFGARLKETVANAVHSCHPKGKPAVSLQPFWRPTISVNDEPENLMVLPPIDESLKDKLMLFKIHKRPMPMATNTQEQRAAFNRKLRSELPAFIHFLINFQIPTDLISERFGIKHFHHSEILEAIDETAPETALKGIIEVVLFGEPGSFTPWEGSSVRLQKELSDSHQSCQFRSLCASQNVLGRYLHRLAARSPGQFIPCRTDRERGWTIHAAGNLTDDSTFP